VAGQIVLKVSNVKFNEKFPAVLHFVSCAQADGQTDEVILVLVPQEMAKYCSCEVRNVAV
jgi:hypothetical protein